MNSTVRTTSFFLATTIADGQISDAQSYHKLPQNQATVSTDLSNRELYAPPPFNMNAPPLQSAGLPPLPPRPPQTQTLPNHHQSLRDYGAEPAGPPIHPRTTRPHTSTRSMQSSAPLVHSQNPQDVVAQRTQGTHPPPPRPPRPSQPGAMPTQLTQ